MLRGLRNSPNIARPEHYSTDRLKQRGMQKRKWPMFHSLRSGTINWTNNGTGLRATLGRLLRNGMGLHGCFRVL